MWNWFSCTCQCSWKLSACGVSFVSVCVCVYVCVCVCVWVCTVCECVCVCVCVCVCEWVRAWARACVRVAAKLSHSLMLKNWKVSMLPRLSTGIPTVYMNIFPQYIWMIMNMRRSSSVTRKTNACRSRSCHLLLQTDSLPFLQLKKCRLSPQTAHKQLKTASACVFVAANVPTMQ